MNEKIKEYADKIAYSCFGEYHEKHETCEICNYKIFCEMVFLENQQIWFLSKRNYNLMDAIKEAHSYMVDGQSSFKWMEVFCILDKAIKETTK